MIQNPNVRRELVKEVAMDLLSYLQDEVDDDLEPSELLSVVYTLAMHVSMTVLEHSTAENREYNRQEILSAIGTLYSAVKPSQMH